MVNGGDVELAQAAVLGAALIDESLVGELTLKVEDRDFATPKCRMVYQALKKLFLAGQPTDPVTVVNQLSGGGEDGWRQYVMWAMDVASTAVNVWEHVRIIREQARLYRLQELGGRLQAARSLEAAQGYIAKASSELVDRPGVKYVTMEEALQDFFTRHHERHEYYSWPLDKLNDRLFVEGGDMVVLGGYSSAGKTALALTFGWHLAGLGKRVGFFSLETGYKKLHDRLIATTMRMNLAKIKRSELDESDYQALSIASKRLIKPELELIEAAGMTVADIQAFSLSRRYDAIFIDYLQLIPSPQGRSRYDAVTDVSIRLHQMSQTTGIAVFPLSQLSRPDKDRDGRKAPNMASLRESGQIEQDADVIMLLYKEDPDRPDSRRVLKIAKNKEGEVGQIYLTFDGNTQTFRESVYDAPAPKPRSEPEYMQVKLGDPPPEGDPWPQQGAS